MYIMTQQHKDKIGNAVKRGKFIKCKNCSKEVWASPYELRRKEQKGFCSRECFKIYYKNNYSKKGSENIFWKNGGLTFTKKIALKRDKYTCQICGYTNKEIMQVDHIKERCLGGKDSLENLQTLCPNCHAKKTYKFLRKKIYAGK